MKTIDMNDFYVDPLLYGNPPQTEVSDEVAEALWQFMRDEQAATVVCAVPRRITR